MFRIAKPESLVLLSPSKEDVRPPCSPHAESHPLRFIFYSGWKAERSRVHAADHGTEVRFLQ